MALNSKYIAVSGVVTYARNSIILPSGTFGLNLDAHLSKINATFGFNTTPHRFDLEYIPENFNFTDLPVIGTNVAFTIGESFYIRGDIVHADYNKSDKGNIVSISIEDDRLDLNKVFLDCYGVFGQDDTPKENIVDVVCWFVKNYVDSRRIGRSLLQKELYLLSKHGASYRQIYEAINYYENTLGTISGIISKIPKPEIVESQLIGDPSTYRWQFKCQPLLECLNKILSDICFDFYWDMRNQKISVINTKYEINIDSLNIPVPDDSAQVCSLRYGKDKAGEATKIQLYGAEMEGIIGGGNTYGTRSGAYGISSSLYNLGISANSSTLTFVPAWKDITIKYYGPDGYLKSDIPTDREYALALKGIELWADAKGLDNRISTSTIDEDSGLTQTQGLITYPDGRPGIIANRANEDRSWIMEWYNKVRSVAQNYYSRCYKLSNVNAIHDYLSQFDIIPAAWCNLENMSEGSGFPDDYRIMPKYNPLAPMWDSENNKLKAFAVFSSQTKWGEDGKASPVQFEDWNEIQGTQVVPIEVRQWDKSSKKFNEEFIDQVDEYERGVLIILPNMCWQSYYTIDSQLAANTTLAKVSDRAAGDTRSDFDDPTLLPVPYPSITQVAIPVRVHRRYGYSYPQVWSSGNGTNLLVEIDEELAPWNFVPRNDSTSVELMNNEALNQIQTKIVNRDEVTFAEVSKLGLPIICFDGFANQNRDLRGYGLINHGVTSLTISKGLDWWQTKYNLKSHFPQFLKIKPIEEGADEDFNFALHRLEEKLIGMIPPDTAFTAPQIFETNTDDKMGKIFMPLEKFDIEVTIDVVYDRGGNEYYLGKDANGISWPRALDSTLFSSSQFVSKARVAHCTDGYLQIGMSAVYHWQDLSDEDFNHWFTGGIPLTAGRVVQLTTTPELINGIWCASVKTMATSVVNKSGGTEVVTPFNFYHVPFMFQQAVDTTLAVDDKLMISSHGNKNNLVPSRDYGPNSNTGNYGDFYLANNSTPSDLWIGHVITRPNAISGRGGVIQTVSATGGITYSDGASVGNYTYNVYFVGCEYDQVEVGDFCIVKREKETGNTPAYRLYCLIQKPLFMGTSAFGG